MNLDQIGTKNFIMALFKRDDGERFLLGDAPYEFKDGLQHFQPNIIANDVVEKQGANGQLLAGQVARSASQSFDGYVCDNSATRNETELARRQFFRFFRPNYFYTVVYILPNGQAVQRKNGYLTEAPSVPEMLERFPEYHVALAFEDLNYYSYNEDAAGDETYAQIYQLEPESTLTGGLVWDAFEGLKISEIDGKTQLSATPTPSSPATFQRVQGNQIVRVDGVDYALALGTTLLDGIDSYSNYIWNDNGTWKLHKAIESVSLGNYASWTTSSWNAQKRIYLNLSALGASAKIPANNSIVAAILCDCYKVVKLDDIINGIENKCVGLSSSGYLSIRDSSKASAAALISEVDSINPTLLYALNTPTETAITDASLIAALNRIKSALAQTTTAPTVSAPGANDLAATIITNASTGDNGIIWTTQTAKGRNLFNKQDYGFIEAYVQSGKIKVSAGTRMAYIKCEPNTTYTVQKTNTGTNQRFAVITTALKPADTVPILNYVGSLTGVDNNDHYTITTHSEAVWLCIFFGVSATTPSTEAIVDTIMVEKGSTMHTYEQFIPAGGAVWDAETGHATTTLTISSLFSVNPIWIVPGPAESPLIENITNNTSLSYLGNISAGQTLIVDCGAQTATLAGANVKNNIRGTWQTFEPGQVVIRYSGANITGPSTLQWNEVVE